MIGQAAVLSLGACPDIRESDNVTSPRPPAYVPVSPVLSDRLMLEIVNHLEDGSTTGIRRLAEQRREIHGIIYREYTIRLSTPTGCDLSAQSEVLPQVRNTTDQ